MERSSGFFARKAKPLTLTLVVSMVAIFGAFTAPSALAWDSGSPSDLSVLCYAENSTTNGRTIVLAPETDAEYGCKDFYYKSDNVGYAFRFIGYCDNHESCSNYVNIYPSDIDTPTCTEDTGEMAGYQVKSDCLTTPGNHFATIYDHPDYGDGDSLDTDACEGSHTECPY